MPNLNKLAWDDLRIVLEVARQGSIYAAAKMLKVDHSTVTRRVSHVEHVLERRLFDRSNKGIRPRAETETFLSHVREMERHAVTMLDEFGQSQQAKVRPVRIATMEGLASGYLARRIEAITNSKFDIRIELFSNPHIVDLLKKETDIFLSFFNPRIPGLISNQVGDVGIYLYGSKNYRRHYGLPPSRDELGSHRYVSYIDEMVSIESVRWLDEIVPNANVVFSSNSVFAQRNAAIQGCGLAALPVFVGEEISSLFRVLSDEIRILRPVWMSVGRDQYFLKAIKQCHKSIEKIFSADRDFLLGEKRSLE